MITLLFFGANIFSWGKYEKNDKKIEKVTYIVKLEILGEKSEICKFYHILVLVVHILIGVIEDKARTLKKRDFRQNEWGGVGVALNVKIKISSKTSCGFS